MSETQNRFFPIKVKVNGPDGIELVDAWVDRMQYHVFSDQYGNVMMHYNVAYGLPQWGRLCLGHFGENLVLSDPCDYVRKFMIHSPVSEGQVVEPEAITTEESTGPRIVAYMQEIADSLVKQGA